MKKLTILFLFIASILSAQTKTVFHVGYGSGIVGGVAFINPLSKEAGLVYGLQYVQRDNRQFVQNNLGASFSDGIMTFTTSAFIGTEIKQIEDLNHVGLSMSVRCTIFKGIGLETLYEQSKTSNFYFQLTFQL
jgi:hypothetical protein